MMQHGGSSPRCAGRDQDQVAACEALFQLIHSGFGGIGGVANHLHAARTFRDRLGIRDAVAALEHDAMHHRPTIFTMQMRQKQHANIND